MEPRGRWRRIGRWLLRDRIRLHTLENGGRATELDVGVAVLRLDDLELDAAVLFPRLFVVARILGTELAVALRAQRALVDLAGNEGRHDAVHAILRELQIVFVGR